jgi:hypothetical protein
MPKVELSGAECGLVLDSYQFYLFCENCGFWFSNHILEIKSIIKKILH